MNIDTYLISLESRKDRRDESLINLEEIGVNKKFINIINALYTPSNGAIGCAKTHAFALSSFLFYSDSDYCLIVEDDFAPVDIEKFKTGIKNVLTSDLDWDVVMLASNMAVPLEASTVSGLFKVINAQTASAYLVSRKFAPVLTRLFYESGNNNSQYLKILDRKTCNHFFAIDMIWKNLQLSNNFFAFLPQISVQRPSFSDIEKKLVNYGV